MSPIVAEPLVVPAGMPKTLEEALHRYGTAMFKAPALTVLNHTGKDTTITYGKLLNKARRVAYSLLNKIGHKGEVRLKPGDRVALIFSNEDAISFACAFYGCLMSGIVAVPIEVPINRDDAATQQIGFLLGTCNISYVITSDSCKQICKTTTGEQQTYKGWPELTWITLDSLSKPPKDWNPPPRVSEDVPAYIEYTIDSHDGSMKGVTVSRSAMISHSKALSYACKYTEGETMVCVLDFKREAGLWHGIQTSILNGMNVIFIDFALMKQNPATWMLTVTKTKATIAICKSRDLHWGSLMTKNHKEINLSSLRICLVADGANPWSLSSCDQFASAFLNRGLRQDAICPCALSAEALTVSIRRPGHAGKFPTGRGILSMSALSHGVIRVDPESTAASLSLQDCGCILPNSYAAVARVNDTTQLCKTDEIGEILISSPSVATCYWSLAGKTSSTFKECPTNQEGGAVYDNQTFVRTGLLGFIGPGSLVFICGTRDGLLQVSGRRHNTEDLIATILSVEPMKFVYRGRIAVFSIRVLRDERICVFAEQRPECTEEDSFPWMSKVLQAVDAIHHVGIYCLALVLPNQLPKTFFGGIHLAEVRRRFLEGSMRPTNILMCPHSTVNNLPKERQLTHVDVGPASKIVGQLIQGNNLAVAQGPPLSGADIQEESPNYISEILKWRSMHSPDLNLFTLLNAKNSETLTLTTHQLHKRSERIGAHLLEKSRVNIGDHIALIYPPGLDLICAFYGCLYIGATPVTIRPPHPHNLHSTLPTAKMIADVSKAVVILTTSSVAKLLKSKEASLLTDLRTWVPLVETDDLPKRKLSKIHRFPTQEMVAYIDFSVSTTGMLSGVKISHGALVNLGRSIKSAAELYVGRHLALAIDPFCGLGFFLWCISGVFSGNHSILVPPAEVELNPSIWLTAISSNKVRDTFCTYSVLEMCTKGLALSVSALKQKGVNLNCVKSCVIVGNERPRLQLIQSFAKLFSGLGLAPRAINTSFGCRSNIAICLQGSSSPETKKVYVDSRALRHDRVTIVEKGAPFSTCLLQSGKLLPGIRLVCADPETKQHVGESSLGEIWVRSPHDSVGYFSTLGNDPSLKDQFNQKLITADPVEASYNYARTGFLGFLRQAGPISCNGATACANGQDNQVSHDVYIVGALDETILHNGLRFYPIDLEDSVMRCCKKIAECCCFIWSNHLVVVAELDGEDCDALDLVPLITNEILENHHVIVGVVVVVDCKTIAINSRGEKQRHRMRDLFLAGQLDPIYVAYNI